ncbi:hypothetical protein K1719_047497 [Acacia pycnantha]|nr:hypothetical protein K1719_047497 [Acacia pycnantha]
MTSSFTARLHAADSTRLYHVSSATSSFASTEEGSNPRALLFPKIRFGDICRFYHGASCFTSDLDDSTDRWAIVVRVFRKWNVYQKYAPAELFCVSMVLIDEEVAVTLHRFFATLVSFTRVSFFGFLLPFH